MVVRRVERELPAGMTASELGEASAEALSPLDERFVLISYLTSPIPEQTKLDYVVFARLPANTDVGIDVDEYEWTVNSPTDSAFAPIKQKTEMGCFWWTGQRAGQQYTVSVTARLNGTDLATARLTQATRQRDQRLETKLKRKRKDPGEPDSQRELINDFGDYVRSAATATGERGISARVLAAILYMEINARPKDGTKRAQLYRSRTKINRNPTWSEWTSEEIQQSLKQKLADNVSKKATWRTDFYPLTEIRCVELTLVGDMFDDLLIGLRTNLFGGKSLGVGQIALSTAAMVTGKMPWIEGTPNELGKARSEVNAAWKDLSVADQADMFNVLQASDLQLCAPGRIRTCTLRIRSKTAPVRLVLPGRIAAGRVGFIVQPVASRAALWQRPDCQRNCQGPHCLPRSAAQRSSRRAPKCRYVQPPCHSTSSTSRSP
jgi:hypothetical protein